MSTTQRAFNRRDLLKGSGALMVAVGFSPAAALAAPKAGSRATAAPPVVDPNQVDAWIAVGADERITILTGKVELGTGVITATAQIVADELDVPMDRIEVVEGDTWQCPDQGTTSGSQSMKTQWASGMRQAAATARAQLLALGAASLGITPDQLEITNGTIHPRGDTSLKVTFGALIGDQQFKTKVNSKAAVKTGKQLQVVGTSVPRIEIPDKLTGFFSYIQDVKIPGMVHGRVVRPPGINATLASFDGWQGKQPAGLIKVVIIKNFVGVVCEREEQAITAAENIKLTWRTGRHPEPPGALGQHAGPGRPGPAAGGGRRRRRGARRSGQEARGDLLLPLPAARLDGPVVRAGRRRQRRRHRVVADAGPRTPCAPPSPAS